MVSSMICVRASRGGDTPCDQNKDIVVPGALISADEAAKDRIEAGTTLRPRTDSRSLELRVLRVLSHHPCSDAPRRERRFRHLAHG